MHFRKVRLRAPAHLLAELEEFYGGIDTGETELEFVPGEGEPFYHFAFLAPPESFAELGPAKEVFDFPAWDATAVYYDDPAGNIVELIAHRGIGESEREGPFSAAELVGISELGLVGDKHELATALREIGLEQWDGAVEEAWRLAFVGEKARTLILSPAGRGWLPTGRPAEAHPCDVELSAVSEGGALLADGRYRIRGRP
jgi:hypothetical protein